MYMNKWATFAASLCIQVSAGYFYCFGVFAPLLKKAFDLDQSQLQTVGSAFNLGGYCGLIAGFVYQKLENQHKLGPRLVLWIGCATNFIGYCSLYLAARGLLAISYREVVLLSFVAGSGNNWWDTADLVTNIRNFPNEKGTVVGVMKAASGLSASAYTTMFWAFFSPKDPTFLAFLAVVPSALVSCLAMWVNHVPYVQKSEVRHFEGSFTHTKRFLVAYLLIGGLALYLLLGSTVFHHYITSQLGRALVAFMVVILLGFLSIIPIGSGGCASQPADTPDTSQNGKAVCAFTARDSRQNIRAKGRIAVARLPGVAEVRDADECSSSGGKVCQQIPTSSLDACMDSLPAIPSGKVHPHDVQKSDQQADAGLWTAAVGRRTDDIICCVPDKADTQGCEGAAAGVGHLGRSRVSKFADHVHMQPHDGDDGPADGHAQLHVPLLVGNRTVSADTDHSLVQLVYAERALPDLTLLQMMGRVDFYLLFFIFLLGTGSGLTFVGNISAFLASLNISAATASSYLSVFSVASAAGRMSFGFFTERQLHHQGIPRTVFLLLSSLLAVVNNAICWRPLGPGMLYAAALIGGLSFGSYWVLTPTIASELFGLEHFAMAWTYILQMAPVLGGFVLATQVAGAIYDRALHDQGHAHTCRGADCFQPTFTILIGTSCFNMILAAVLWYRTRAAYAHIVAHLHAVDRFVEEEEEWAEEQSRVVEALD